MKILIVAATEHEIMPLSGFLKLKKNSYGYEGNFKKYHIDILITGIGMVATACKLSKILTEKKFELALNIGIAGSFRKEIGIGDLVNVVEDRFSELGVESENGFTLLEDLKNLNGELVTDTAGLFVNPHNILPACEIRQVYGITVNTVHGHTENILKIVEICNPDIETMEGAAFMYVCLAENIRFLQLRSISNFVETRNREKWNVSLAVQSLNKRVFSLLDDEKF